MIFKRKAERRRQDIIQELEMLQDEFPRQWSYINDMILYAEVGKDRMNLPDNFVSGIASDVLRFETEDQTARDHWKAEMGEPNCGRGGWCGTKIGVDA